MTVTIDTAVAELKDQSLVDPSAHLKPKGRDEVLAEIDRWKSRGIRARVLVVDPGDSFDELLGAFDKLHLDPDSDLLLVFNTRDFAGRGWGMSRQEIERALANLPHAVFSHMIVRALDALANATTRAARTEHGISLLPIVGGTVGVAAAGLVALAIVRRNKLAKQGMAKLGDARASAERAYADLMLACEDLPGDAQASEIQLRASELKKRMDAIVTETEARPVKGNDPVQIGKLHQLENELAALRSTVLQKEKH
jgi:hypothetical protein